MNQNISLLSTLKEVLQDASEGEGIGRSLVKRLTGAGMPAAEAARLILLGHPIPGALRPLVEGGSEEVSMVASLVVSAPRSSASMVGNSGGALTSTLEGWIRSRETRRLEDRVFRFRGLVASAVLGAVTAMLASLGPLVGNLNFTSVSQSVQPGPLLYAAASMAGIGSGMLGLYMSGRGMIVNVLLTFAIFGVVATAASPLASVTPAGLWGIK